VDGDEPDGQPDERHEVARVDHPEDRVEQLRDPVLRVHQGQQHEVGRGQEATRRERDRPGVAVQCGTGHGILLGTSDPRVSAPRARAGTGSAPAARPGKPCPLSRRTR
jgi:hypothetical protein